jgi:hypothetical protein
VKVLEDNLGDTRCLATGFVFCSYSYCVCCTQAAAATGGGWQCLKCTFINVPTRPGCEMCTAARPLDYKLPPHFSLSAREEARMMRERESEAEARKVLLDLLSDL